MSFYSFSALFYHGMECVINANGKHRFLFLKFYVLLETCKSFDATISLLDKTQAHIASVRFTMDTTFDFYSENSDFRTIGIKTYDPPHNVQNQAYLTVNNEQECPL